MSSVFRRGTVPFSLRENRDSPQALFRPILSPSPWVSLRSTQPTLFTLHFSQLFSDLK